MRTLQEKYNGVLEGNFSKAQFVRDARMAHPTLITQFNSFEDATAILKNRGMIAEAKAETTVYKKPEVDPADLVAPDVLDKGIKAELDLEVGETPTEEEYEKAKEKAAKKLAKDSLAYAGQDQLAEETALDRAQNNAATKVQNTLGDIADTVAEKPASVAAAFKKKVMADPVKYAKMSASELEKEFEAFKLEEGHGENPEKFKEADAFDPTKFYIKDLKSGRILNAVSVQGSKLILHYDTEADAQAQADWITRWEGDPGRFEVLPGTDPEVEALVSKQTGTGEKEKSFFEKRLDKMRAQQDLKEEQQLKESIKKIIAKVIAE